MDGTPALALQLLHLAKNLELQLCPRGAALAFASAASAPAVSPNVQAFALYKASLCLYASSQRAASPEKREDDRVRALQYLQKCSLLIRSQTWQFDSRMQVYALFENIYTAAGDQLSAAKTINAALGLLTKSDEDDSLLLRWWVYFRGRVVSNALATGQSISQAMVSASQSADQLTRSGDLLSGTAFYLASCQIALSMTSPTQEVRTDFDKAHKNLGAIRARSPVERCDITTLHLYYLILQCFACIKVGNVEEAGATVLPHLETIYNKYMHIQRSNPRGFWKWLSPTVISALMNMVVAITRRGQNDPQALQFAMKAAERIGVPLKDLTAIHQSYFPIPDLSRPAVDALRVAILENAARICLVEVDFQKARPFVVAAAQILFSERTTWSLMHQVEQNCEVDLSQVLSPVLPPYLLTLRTAVFLLLAEYHSLRGRTSTAQTATIFLRAIQNVSTAMLREMGEVWLSDSWQQAISYLSLLTGVARNSDSLSNEATPSASRAQNGDHLRVKNFVNKQVLAVANFAAGVVHMRSPNVIESRNTLSRAYEIVKGGHGRNRQVIANILGVYSGLGMVHHEITEEEANMTMQAIQVAQEINDYATLARTWKQRRKLVYRTNADHSERTSTEHNLISADRLLISKQGYGRNVFSET